MSLCAFVRNEIRYRRARRLPLDVRAALWATRVIEGAAERLRAWRWW